MVNSRQAKTGSIVVVSPTQIGFQTVVAYSMLPRKLSIITLTATKTDAQIVLCIGSKGHT